MFEVAKRLKSETNAHKPSSAGSRAKNRAARIRRDLERMAGKVCPLAVINHCLSPKDYSRVPASPNRKLCQLCTRAATIPGYDVVLESGR